MNHQYPLTGCGLPNCRTCHPELTPPLDDHLYRDLLGAAGLVLFAIALLFLLPGIVS